MCLLVIGFGVSGKRPLIFAGNRDEFHSRPASPADWWEDAPDILGGRDLQAGGTWLALHRGGRFATVTNYRDAVPTDPALRSRGHLVTDYLSREHAPLDFLRSIDGSAYAGFNLLVSDARELAYMSNRGVTPRRLTPGIYGLSNASLDTPWEKVERSKHRLERLLADGQATDERLLELLNDRDRGPVGEVPTGRLPFDTAHALTAPFVVLPDYGTRCSTVITASSTGAWSLVERRFDAHGRPTGESYYSIESEDVQ